MIVFLHPLPLDGTVWSDDIRGIGPSIAPDLHDFGSDVGAWAEGAIAMAGDGQLDLVGNSVGDFCVLEGTGHYGQLEKPEELLGIVGSFLTTR